LGIKKKVVLLHPKIHYNDKENVSAFKPEKEEQAWFPRADGIRERA
jgi:hypothetical protein